MGIYKHLLSGRSLKPSFPRKRESSVFDLVYSLS